MGGCATKPKVLKGDEGEVPEEAPAPETVKESGAAAVTESKEVVVVEDSEKKKAEGEAEVGKVKEIVEEDHETKPRSLSNLFKSEEATDTAGSDNALSEPVKKEGESKEIEKVKEDENKAKTEEKEPSTETAEKTVVAADHIHTTSSDFVDAPEKPIVEKAAITEDKPATEIKDVSEKTREETK